MIRLEDITVAYDDRIILNHVNLDIHDGETLAVIGASGSGKSTTLRLIMGLQNCLLQTLCNHIWKTIDNSPVFIRLIIS